MENNHYIYLHYNLDKKEVYYVGQGTHSKKGNTHKSKYDRAYSKRSRNKFWINYTNKYGNPRVYIILDNINQELVNFMECLIIDQLGRRDLNEGILLNLKNGGDGNGPQTLEQRKAQSIRMSGENHPMWGKKYPKSWTESMSKSQLGKKLSEETKKKMSESKTGSKRSEETRKKMSEAQSGNKNAMYGMVGDLNPASKLNWELVDQIRSLYKEGNTSLRKLAKLFNVSAFTIESIIKNRSWKIK